MMTKKRMSKTLLTTLVWIGYLSTLLSWCWFIICYSHDILNSDIVQYLSQVENRSPEIKASLAPINLPLEVLAPFAVVIAILVIAYVIKSVISAPSNLKKVSEKTIQQSADKLTLIATTRRNLNKKQKKVLRSSVVYALRTLITIIPALIALFAGQQSSFVPHSYILIGTLVPGVIGFGVFGIVFVIESHLATCSKTAGSTDEVET